MWGTWLAGRFLDQTWPHVGPNVGDLAGWPVPGPDLAWFLGVPLPRLVQGEVSRSLVWSRVRCPAPSSGPGRGVPHPRLVQGEVPNMITNNSMSIE